MIKSSVTISFLLWLYRAFCESKTYAVLQKCASFLGRALADSIFGKIFSLAKYTICRESSVFYKIIGYLFGLVYKFFEKIHHCAKSGIIYKAVHFILSKSSIFKTENMICILIGVMFVCPHEVWNNLYGLAIALLCLFMYIVSSINREGFGKSVKNIWFPFVLFVMATIYSAIVTYAPADSIRVFMFFVTSFILCVVFTGVASSKERFDKICFTLFVAMIITGFVAIAQNIAGIEVDPSLTDVQLNTNMPGRAFSTWANPNNYAQFLIIFFPFAIAYVMTRKSAKIKMCAAIFLAVPFVALLLTYSRSGWLGFLMAFMTFVLLYNKKLFPVMVIVGIMAIPLLPQSILNRIMTIGNLQDSSSAYRIDIWTGTLHMIDDYWKTGTGLGPAAFKSVYSLYGIGASRIAPHTHMLFMEILAEMGIIGIVCFGVFIVCLIVRSCKNASLFKGDSKVKAYTVAAAASMMGILTIGFAEYVWFYPRVMFAFFVAIGMAMAAVKLSDGKNLKKD